jgi:PAS domain S-box-containing protein
MSLRWKLSVAVMAVAIAVVAAVFAISQFTFAREFQSIEDHQAKAMATRASNALADRFQSLNTLNYDWAAWDDTYSFVQEPDRHQDYVENNPTDATFASIAVNFLFIINNAGQTVYSKGFNLSDNTDMPIPNSLVLRVSEGDLTEHASVNDSTAGVVVIPEGALLVSSQPIVTSHNKGPIMGTVVMARFVDQALINDLQNKLLVPVALLSFSDLPHNLEAFEVSSGAPTPTSARTVDSKSIAGYAMVNDIAGDPAFVLSVSIPRDIYSQRIATTRYFVMSLLGIGVLFAVTFNLLLSRIVTSRVHQVGAYAGNVAEKGDLSRRLPVTGSDELARLSKDMNHMVEVLQESRQALRLKEEDESRLRRMIQSVSEGIAFTNLTGTIKDVNEAQVRLCGYSDGGQLVGTRFLDLVAPNDRNGARDNMEEALQTATTRGGEYAMLRKNGTTFSAELSAVAVRDKDTRPIGFVITTRNVDERKPVGARQSG